MQTVDQLIDFLILAANFDLQTLGIGANPTCQTEFLGEAPDKGAKANALNDAGQANAVAENVAWVFVTRHGIGGSD